MRCERAPERHCTTISRSRSNFGEALRDIVLRNELSADLRDLVLVGLAHVEEEDVFAGVEAAA